MILKTENILFKKLIKQMIGMMDPQYQKMNNI